MHNEDLIQMVHYTRYRNLLDQYHKDFPSIEELENKMKTFTSKTGILGLGVPEYIIFDDALFLTKIPKQMTKLVVPDFVFGFATVELDNNTSILGWFESINGVFSQVEEDLEVEFKRPVVNVKLHCKTVNGKQEYFRDPNYGYRNGGLFEGYRGKELTLKNLEFGSMEGDYMFHCKNLEKINFMGKLNTRGMTSAKNMFDSCKFKELTLPEGFDTTFTKSMAFMFFNNIKLETLDLSHCTFNTLETKDFKSIFYGCRKLNQIILGPDFNIENAKYHGNILNMFKGCPGWRGIFEQLFPEAQLATNTAGQRRYIVEEDTLEKIKECIDDLSGMQY